MPIRGLALIAIALLACAAPLTPSQEAHPSTREPASGKADQAELQLVKTDVSGALFLKRDHHMGNYDQVIIDLTVVTSTTGANHVTPGEKQRLETYLREAAMREFLRVDSSRVVTDPGPCVMRIRMVFTDLELPNLELGSSSTAYVSSFGSVTLINEVSDSLTGEVVLRYVARRRASGGTFAGGEQWSQLRTTLNRLLGDLREDLVASVPVSVARSGPQAGCHGGIFEDIAAAPSK
jgi:hypothetical protein